MKNKGKNKKQLVGEVLSNKMNKAVVVRVTRKFAHPKYGKIIKKSKKYKVSTNEKLEIGDVILIESVRPISKDINFRLVKKVK